MVIKCGGVIKCSVVVKCSRIVKCRGRDCKVKKVQVPFTTKVTT